MANVLSTEKQTAIVAALAEGSSIRSRTPVLKIHPTQSASDAVRAAIVQEINALGTEES
jgi:hypothetical protein